MEEKKRKISVYSVIGFIVLALYCALLLLFFVWAIVSSLKTEMDFFFAPLSLPSKKGGWQWKNYAVAFRYMKIVNDVIYNGLPASETFTLMDMFVNSLLYSLGCTFFATMVPCLVAYATVKYKFRLNKYIVGAVLFAMAVPIVGSLPSEIKIAKAVGLYDQMWGLWLMKANFLGMYFLVFQAHFKSIPWEYAESVFIDGGNHYTVLFRIMLPLSVPTFLAIGLLLFISFWNDYQTPLTFLPSRPTAAFGLYHFTYLDNTTDPKTGLNLSSIPMRLTGCIILMIPILIVFILLKNKIMGNLTIGGLKG